MIPALDKTLQLADGNLALSEQLEELGLPPRSADVRQPLPTEMPMQAARRAAGRGRQLEGSFERFSQGADEEFNVDLSPIRDSERFEDAEGAAEAPASEEEEEEVRWSRRQPGARPAAPRGRAGAFRQKDSGDADAEGGSRGPRPSPWTPGRRT